MSVCLSQKGEYVQSPGHSKKIVGFPPSAQDFFVVKYHIPLNARVFGYLDSKFHNLPLFVYFR